MILWGVEGEEIHTKLMLKFAQNSKCETMNNNIFKLNKEHKLPDIKISHKAGIN